MELLNVLAPANFAAQTASYTGTAAATSGWSAGPEGVMVWSTTPCYVSIGENVVATSADTPIPANTPIPFKIPASVSGIWRVSALKIADDGVVYCKPINAR